ncbi:MULTISPECIES: hypothetical protein [unclassified Bradyrhizobium]|uniref:hypothetical protein n=2 Tax=Nitrobacteraceae TaxID=41294 RepID=UPI0028F02BCD|nr:MULTISPECIES: hypothetical protein [unclassified Bradyrhizobium]
MMYAACDVHRDCSGFPSNLFTIITINKSTPRGQNRGVTASMLVRASSVLTTIEWASNKAERIHQIEIGSCTLHSTIPPAALIEPSSESEVWERQSGEARGDTRGAVCIAVNRRNGK